MLNTSSSRPWQQACDVEGVHSTNLHMTAGAPRQRDTPSPATYRVAAVADAGLTSRPGVQQQNLPHSGLCTGTLRQWQTPAAVSTPAPHDYQPVFEARQSERCGAPEQSGHSSNFNSTLNRWRVDSVSTRCSAHPKEAALRDLGYVDPNFDDTRVLSSRRAPSHSFGAARESVPFNGDLGRRLFQSISPVMASAKHSTPGPQHGYYIPRFGDDSPRSRFAETTGTTRRLSAAAASLHCERGKPCVSSSNLFPCSPTRSPQGSINLMSPRRTLGTTPPLAPTLLLGQAPTLAFGREVAYMPRNLVSHAS